MKFRPTSVILLVVALVLATSSAIVARNLMRPPPPKAAAKEQPKPSPSLVLTATRAIDPGDFIDRGIVEWVVRHDDAIRSGHIVGKTFDSRRKQEQNLFGSTVRHTIPAGEAVIDNLLLPPGSPGFIAAVLAPGMRAISIPTSAVTSNAGLVNAGDWVDVILSVERDEAAAMSMQAGTGMAQANLAAQTILRRVRVLALNSDTGSLAPVAVPAAGEQDATQEKQRKTQQNPRRMVFETITLEVTPEAAEQLAVAREAGSLQVVLRGVKDSDQSAASLAGSGLKLVTRLQDTTAIFNDKAKAAAQVQTFHGDKAAKVTF